MGLLRLLGNYARIAKVISEKQKVISDSGYRRLIAWQKSDLLAEKVYDVTELFPKSEQFGLTSQLRRACLSVPVNIIEGYARVNKNEFRRFLSIALGSLAEVEYFINFSFKRKLMSGSDHSEIINLKEECGRLVWRLYKSLG